jgi:hypothetical protein
MRAVSQIPQRCDLVERCREGEGPRRHKVSSPILRRLLNHIAQAVIASILTLKLLIRRGRPTSSASCLVMKDHPEWKKTISQKDTTPVLNVPVRFIVFVCFVGDFPPRLHIIDGRPVFRSA